MGKLILVGLGCALVYWGGQGVYTAATNSEPTVLGCGQLKNTEVDAIWLRLEDCRYDLMESLQRGIGSVATELFIPVRAADAEGSETVQVIVVSRDDDLLDRYNRLERMKEEERIQFVLEMTRPRTVEGLVQYGATLSEEERDEIAGLSDVLAPNFLMLEEGERPSWLWAAIKLLGGLAIVVFVVGRLLYGLSRKSEADEGEGAGDEA